MTKTEQLAREAYDIYCAAVGGKAWNGQPLPTAAEFFEDATKTTQADGWRAVAEHFLTTYNHD